MSELDPETKRLLGSFGAAMLAEQRGEYCECAVPDVVGTDPLCTGCNRRNKAQMAAQEKLFKKSPPSWCLHCRIDHHLLCDGQKWPEGPVTIELVRGGKVPCECPHLAAKPASDAPAEPMDLTRALARMRRP